MLTKTVCYPRNKVMSLKWTESSSGNPERILSTAWVLFRTLLSSLIHIPAPPASMGAYWFMLAWPCGAWEDNPPLSWQTQQFLGWLCWDLTLIVGVMAKREYGGQITTRASSEAAEKAKPLQVRMCVFGEGPPPQAPGVHRNLEGVCPGSQVHLPRDPHASSQAPASSPSRPWLWSLLGIQPSLNFCCSYH